MGTEPGEKRETCIYHGRPGRCRAALRNCWPTSRRCVSCAPNRLWMTSAPCPAATQGQPAGKIPFTATAQGIVVAPNTMLNLALPRPPGAEYRLRRQSADSHPVGGWSSSTASATSPTAFAPGQCRPECQLERAADFARRWRQFRRVLSAYSTDRRRHTGHGVLLPRQAGWRTLHSRHVVYRLT